MNDTFDKSGFEQLIEDYSGFEKKFSNLYDSLCSNNSTVKTDIYTQYGIGNHSICLGKGLSKTLEQMVPFKGNVNKLYGGLETYLEKALELRAMGREDFSQALAATSSFGFGFSTSKRSQYVSELYRGYNVAGWVDSDMSFDQYNDINSFMSSDQYWANNTFITGASEYSNYKLIGVGTLATLLNDPSLLDYYTDQFLVDSIMSVMDSMSEEQREPGLSGRIKTETGLKAWDKIVGLIKDKMIAMADNPDAFWNDKAYTGGYTYFDDKFMMPAADMWLKDPEIAAWVDILAEECGMTSSQISNFMAGVMEGISEVGKKVGYAMEMVPLIDTLMKYHGNLLKDYSTQISYLDTIQESLISNGFPSEKIHNAIDEVRNRYVDAAYALQRDAKGIFDKYLNKYSSKIVQGSQKKFVEMAGDKAGAEFVGKALGEINAGLSTVSTIASIAGAKQIAADKTLMGLKQWDSCLTRNFENYQDMINKGIASKNDMEEAEKIYQTLLNVKKQEYQAMMDMCKEGNAKYNYFKQKYDELDAWSKGNAGPYSQSDLLKDEFILNQINKGSGSSSGHGASRDF